MNGSEDVVIPEVVVMAWVWLSKWLHFCGAEDEEQNGEVEDIDEQESELVIETLCQKHGQK